MNCENNFNDPWCFCFNDLDQSIPQYKQFNADGNTTTSQGKGFHCCHILHYDPSFLAANLPNQGFIANAYDYLELMNNTVINDVCDYNKFLNQVSNNLELEQRFPELYQNVEKHRLIFNSFFNSSDIIHNSNVNNNQELIPTFQNYNVTCPNSNYVPYYLNYDINTIKPKTMFVCYPKNVPFPNLDLDYKTLFFYDNNGNDCKKNECNTKALQSSFGYNAGQEAHVSPDGNKLTGGYIAAIVVSSLLLAVFLILFIYFAYITIKENNSKQQLNN